MTNKHKEIQSNNLRNLWRGSIYGGSFPWLSFSTTLTDPAEIDPLLETSCPNATVNILRPDRYQYCNTKF